MIKRTLLGLTAVSFPFLIFAQIVTTTNTVGGTGVAAIQSTTSPNYSLSVGGSLKLFGTGYTGARSSVLFIGNTTPNTGRTYGLNSYDNGLFTIYDVNAASAARFAIDPNGNIGMGTTAPLAKLHVTGDVRMVNLQLNNGYNGIVASCLATHVYNSCGTNGFITFGFTNASGANTAASDPLTIRQLTNAIGIRNNNPSEALDVIGNTKTTGLIIPTGAAAGKVLTSDATGNATWQAATGGAGSNSWTLTGANISNTNTGLVIIGGTTSPDATDLNLKLAVKGNIYAQKLKVTQTGWADYVFAPNYQLRPLPEVSAFIKQHQRLPELPSTAEVEKNGIDVGNNQVLLLKKIEELTLYVIKEHTDIQQLKNTNAKLQQENRQIKNLLKQVCK